MPTAALATSLYVGQCSPSLVPVGTFQTVSLRTRVNRLAWEPQESKNATGIKYKDRKTVMPKTKV